MDHPRVAVVVGGASGIGRAISVALAATNHRVTVADLNGAAATELAEQLGPGHTAQTVDITDEDSVATLFTTLPDRPHTVVNSAGISTLSPIVDHDTAQFRGVLDTCLTGAFLVMKHAGRQLVDRGVLISLTSLNGRQPGVGMAAYCAAKAGLSMLTEVAALEWAHRGVRVNAIAPGLVQTPLTEPAMQIPGITEDYLANTPLGRPGTVEEIAAAAVYLASDGAAWITGEVLDINGGAHLARYPDLLSHVQRAFG